MWNVTTIFVGIVWCSILLLRGVNVKECDVGIIMMWHSFVTDVRLTVSFDVTFFCEQNVNKAVMSVPSHDVTFFWYKMWM